MQWSREAEELLGRAAAEVLGQPVGRVVSRTVTAAARRVLSRLRGDRPASRADLRVRRFRMSGSAIWTRCVGTSPVWARRRSPITWSPGR
ncbi:PAS domain-containing protein [Streptomyces carpinensis]|uniref:PAS domain-containing protein n=1 Tax=Streptomyces carpinensis TaxID=66369 RepID=UPI003CC56563